MCLCAFVSGCVPADVRVRMQDGTTCLWMSCQEGHLDVARFIVGEGGRELLMKADDVSDIGVADLCECIWRDWMCCTAFLA